MVSGGSLLIITTKIILLLPEDRLPCPTSTSYFYLALHCLALPALALVRAVFSVHEHGILTTAGASSALLCLELQPLVIGIQFVDRCSSWSLFSFRGYLTSS